jgi:hypothetical protein
MERKMNTDIFQAEKDPDRKNGWRIVRVENGERLPLGQHFNKEKTAQRRAYELTVRHELRRNRPVYLGD